MAERVEGLDEAWLARAAARDPVAHAYAVWDLRHEPDRVRFVSVRERGETVAYRLEWRGPTHPPVLHWVGPGSARELLGDWPDRPFVAVVPPEVAGSFGSPREPVTPYPVELRALHGPLRIPPRTPSARRLRASDRAALSEFVASESERLLHGYHEPEFDRTPLFGAFVRDRLVAVAKASVVLPRVWILTGIVSGREHRGHGFGRAVTAAAAGAAIEAGARPALYVRSDNVAAVRVYASLGFEVESRKIWIDAGADWPP